jgi:hypothetical protein
MSNTESSLNEEIEYAEDSIGRVVEINRSINETTYFLYAQTLDILTTESGLLIGIDFFYFSESYNLHQDINRFTIVNLPTGHGSVDRQTNLHRALTDASHFHDSVHYHLIFARHLADTVIGSSDSVTREVDSTRTASDVFSFSDNAHIPIVETVSLVEYLALDTSISNDEVSRNVTYVRNLTDTTLCTDELSVYIPPYWYLGERVQFTWNGAFCQGTVIQLLYGPTDKIVIEVDVCSDFTALSNFNYNRVTVPQRSALLVEVKAPAWY